MDETSNIMKCESIKDELIKGYSNGAFTTSEMITICYYLY